MLAGVRNIAATAAVRGVLRISPSRVSTSNVWRSGFPPTPGDQIEALDSGHFRLRDRQDCQRELSAFDTASEFPAPSSIAILTQARKLAFLDYVCSREQRTSERIDSADMSQI